MSTKDYSCAVQAISVLFFGDTAITIGIAICGTDTYNF
jgi:hypothetical protein